MQRTFNKAERKPYFRNGNIGINTQKLIDSNIANVSLLLPMNGSNNSTTFTDFSANNFAVTANGNARISTTRNKFGGSSGYFDGTGDYISIASPTNDIVNWYSTNFTIEAWVYMDAAPSNGGNGHSSLCGNAVHNTTTEYWSFGPLNARTVRFYYFTGSNVNITTTTTLNLSQWYHIAFVRNSTNLKIYIDGVESASGTQTGTPQSATGTPFNIGQIANGNFNGYIDDFRITKAARYTANFTPPSREFPTN